jgi:Flp pilus assembly protein CpaB
VQNQQKAKYINRNVLQKNRVLTAKEAIAKKETNQLKRQVIVNKKNAYLV